MKALENKIPPPIVTVIIGAAMWGAAKRLPAITMESRLHYRLAGAIALFALVVSALAILSFRWAKTTINPVRINAASSVVTNGIFRYTRNPMYVGLTSLLTSWAVYLAVPWTLLGPIIFALFTHRFQILPEERVLSAKFGKEYDEYRRRVRRWI